MRRHMRIRKRVSMALLVLIFLVVNFVVLGCGATMWFTPKPYKEIPLISLTSIVAFLMLRLAIYHKRRWALFSYS